MIPRRISLALALGALACLGASRSFATPPRVDLRVELRVGDASWTTGPATPLAGERVSLRADVAADETLRWFELVPDLGRDHHNAEWPWNPGAYAWLGFERVAVRRVPIPQWDGLRTVTLPRGVPLALPRDFEEERPRLRRREWGTFWLQCEATDASGRMRRTPGIEDGDQRGLHPDTLRLSVRRSDGFAGWITTFANVPSVFGSTPHQSCHWLGADCADVVMVSRATWLGLATGRDWNVAAIVTTLPRRAETDLTEGVASSRLRWGHDVRPGDVIAVRYAGGRAYQHVGVLESDADADGLLGPADLVLHAGPLPLQLAPLRDGAFDGHVIILDPTKR